MYNIQVTMQPYAKHTRRLLPNKEKCDEIQI